MARPPSLTACVPMRAEPAGLGCLDPLASVEPDQEKHAAGGGRERDEGRDGAESGVVPVEVAWRVGVLRFEGCRLWGSDAECGVEGVG